MRILLTHFFRLFERGANFVGLDFLAHPFWDNYLEFEERAEAQDKIFSILERVVKIPMHQYARYFERYRQMVSLVSCTIRHGNIVSRSVRHFFGLISYPWVLRQY